MIGIETLPIDKPILAAYCVWNTVNGRSYVGVSAHTRHRLLCMASSLQGTRIGGAARTSKIGCSMTLRTQSATEQSLCI